MSWGRVVMRVVVYGVGMVAALLFVGGMVVRWLMRVFSWGGAGDDGGGARARPAELVDKAGWEHRWVQTRRALLHVVVAGNDGGDARKKPLVILLHGFPDSWYGWRQQMGYLAERGSLVVAVEMRGYGESAGGAPGEARFSDAASCYNQREIAEDIEALPAAFGRDKIDVLVGHDFGGVAAWFVAARGGTALVRRLVILNATHPASFLHHVARSPSQMLKCLYMAFFMLPVLPEWLLRAGDYAALDRIHGPYVPAHELHVWKWTLSRPGALTAALNYYRAFLSDETLDEMDRLWPSDRPEHDDDVRSPVPTTVLWGTADAALELAGMATVHRWVKICEVVQFDGISHWVQQQVPNDVAAYIQTVVAALQAAE
jgi:pimeloyl-ACP methyl ester carboxylesterase